MAPEDVVRARFDGSWDIGVQPQPEFIRLAHPEGRRPSAKLRAFADCLRHAFGQPPYRERFESDAHTRKR